MFLPQAAPPAAAVAATVIERTGFPAVPAGIHAAEHIETKIDLIGFINKSDGSG
jgi:hypothetical protein